ncbi:hypothetical protein ACWEQL_05915 [Kitasatospora sp. NPDC004240]
MPLTGPESDGTSPAAALVTVRLTARAGGGFQARITLVEDLAAPGEVVSLTAGLDELRHTVDAWLTAATARLSAPAPAPSTPAPPPLVRVIAHPRAAVDVDRPPGDRQGRHRPVRPWGAADDV